MRKDGKVASGSGNIKFKFKIYALLLVFRFLEFFIQKFVSLKRFLKILHVWQHLLICFAAGFTIIQSQDNNIQMSL